MCANILTLWLHTNLKRWETDIILTSNTSKRARFRAYQCIRRLAVTFARTGKCLLTSCNRNCRLELGKNQKWFNALRFVMKIMFFPEGYRCWWWWKYSSEGEEGSAVIRKYYLRLRYYGGTRQVEIISLHWWVWWIRSGARLELDPIGEVAVLWVLTCREFSSTNWKDSVMFSVSPFSICIPMLVPCTGSCRWRQLKQKRPRE